MSFLIIKDGKIVCTEEGMMLPEVQIIYNNDKTGKGKTYFSSVITAIYYLYKPRGIYWNKSLSERIKLVNQDHLSGTSWEELVKRQGVQELATKFHELSGTINDSMLDTLRTDAEEILKTLRTMPAVIRKELPVGFEVLCDDGIIRKTAIKIPLEVPNIDEKKKLWDFSLSLSANLKKIEENLKIEEDERIREAQSRRIYDGQNAV